MGAAAPTRNNAAGASLPHFQIGRVAQLRKTHLLPTHGLEDSVTQGRAIPRGVQSPLRWPASRANILLQIADSPPQRSERVVSATTSMFECGKPIACATAACAVAHKPGRVTDPRQAKQPARCAAPLTAGSKAVRGFVWLAASGTRVAHVCRCEACRRSRSQTASSATSARRARQAAAATYPPRQSMCTRPTWLLRLLHFRAD